MTLTAELAQNAPSSTKFTSLKNCWVCGNDRFRRVHQAIFEFNAYIDQDPELAEYTGEQVWIQRCTDCGFIQPEQLPVLREYFDRMYDQHWSEEWVEEEFRAPCKDYIFESILRSLTNRCGTQHRKLLDIGAHAGRFMHLAREAGWQPEGVELNPRTAAFAGRQTGLPVHQVNALELVDSGHQYNAITLTDVLEHIPDPVRILETSNQLLEPGGWISVKVPCGPAQILKEGVRARILSSYRATVADNLVHINHFSAVSLRRALANAGFTNISVTLGAPELFDSGGSWKAALQRKAQIAAYHLGRLVPGGARSPLALHLQAFAQKPG